MAQGCGANCARIILIFFNIIFWLSGAALVAVGLYLIFGNEFDAPIGFLQEVDSVISGLNGSLIMYAAYAFIGIGVFVIIVGFCGCCGAIKENKCMLGCYIFFLVIIMLAEAAVGGLVIFFNEKILDTVSETYKELATDKYESNAGFRAAVNHFQVEFECCGWNGVGDYANVTYQDITGIAKLKVEMALTMGALGLASVGHHLEAQASNGCPADHDLRVPVAGVENCTGTQVPSCCVFNDTSSLPDDYGTLTYSEATDGDGCKMQAEGTFQTETCMDAVDKFLDKYSVILIGVAIGIACLELFGVIFAICLCRNIGE